MLKLNLQYFDHLMPKVNSLERTLILGKTEGRRRSRWQRIRWLDDITNTMDMSLRKFQEMVKDRAAWHVAVQRVTKNQTWLSHRTTLQFHYLVFSLCCSHEIKRRSLLGRKVMTNLDGVLKSRDITLPKNIHLGKVMLFPTVMYACESWTIKKAEHQRINAFELWCWIRLLRVPWTAEISNQFILKEISPEYSLEGLMLKLKLQYLWPPDAKSWLIWKDADAGKDWRWEDKGTTEDEMVGWHHWLNGHEFE